MGSYIKKYMRERYVSRRIRRDLYDRFISWCGESSINICLEKALSILVANITPNMDTNTAPNTGASIHDPELERELEEVFSQLERELEEGENRGEKS